MIIVAAWALAACSAGADESAGGMGASGEARAAGAMDMAVDDPIAAVCEHSTTASAATTVVTDLTAPISTLRASATRIEGLLADAASISDMTTLENEFDSREAELEALEAPSRPGALPDSVW